MSVATAETIELLVAFTLPRNPFSVHMARFYARAAQGHYNLGGNTGNTGDIETVTSELVGNAVRHAGGFAVSLILTRAEGLLAVVVGDLSPDPPVKRPLDGDAADGRGLHIVEALSARWGWLPQAPGKAVYAVFTTEA
jgi:anti-sigma regulatory factor (Ser/Thr protein kinase)